MGPPRQSGPLALDPGKLLGVILPQQGPAPNSCSRSCLGSTLEHEPARHLPHTLWASTFVPWACWRWAHSACGAMKHMHTKGTGPLHTRWADLAVSPQDGSLA